MNNEYEQLTTEVIKQRMSVLKGIYFDKCFEAGEEGDTGMSDYYDYKGDEVEEWLSCYGDNVHAEGYYSFMEDAQEDGITLEDIQKELENTSDHTKQQWNEEIARLHKADKERQELFNMDQQQRDKALEEEENYHHNFFNGEG